jgi:hypothetical protein
MKTNGNNSEVIANEENKNIENNNNNTVEQTTKIQNDKTNKDESKKIIVNKMTVDDPIPNNTFEVSKANNNFKSTVELKPNKKSSGRGLIRVDKKK